MRVISDLLNRLLGLAVVGVVCAMMAAPGGCLAQGEGEEELSPEDASAVYMEEYYAQQYLPRLRMMAVLCQLTDEQIAASVTLQESFIQRSIRADSKMGEYTAYLEKELSAGAMTADERGEKLQAVYRDKSAYVSKMTDELKADLKDLLTEDQLAQWPWVEIVWRVQEQEYRLYDQMHRGQNLLKLVSTKLEDSETSPEMRVVLEKHLTELDRVLELVEREYDAFSEERRRIRSDETLTEEEKAEAYRQLGRPGKDAQAKVREISEASVRRMVPLLPELEAAELELGFYERHSYGQERMFPDLTALCRKVMGMKSVTEEQKAQIREFRLQVVRARVAELKKENREKVDDDEGEFDQQKMMADMQRMIVDSNQQLERLRSFLTAEQIELAGPPLSASATYVPDFESDDEPPKMKSSAMSMGGGWRPSVAPQVNALDIAFLSRIAAFDEAQKEAAGNLVLGYESRFRLAMRKIKAFEASMASSMEKGGMADAGVMKRGMAVMAKGHRFLTRIRRELLDDLRSLLTEEQVPKWEAFERRIQRKGVGQGEMAFGGNMSQVDLPGMLEGAFVDGAMPSDEMMEIVESYEREMQPLVAEISAIEAEQVVAIEKAAEADGFNIIELFGRMEAGQVKAEELGVRVQALNQQYFKRLSGMMEGEPRMVFEEAMIASAMQPLDMFRFNERQVPDPFELSREIDRLKDLTEAQRERVREIAAAKRGEIHEVRLQLYEHFIAIEWSRSDWNKLFETTRSEPMLSMFKRLNTLQDTMAKELMAELTPEQVGRLPKKWRKHEKVSYPRFDED